MQEQKKIALSMTGIAAGLFVVLGIAGQQEPQLAAAEAPILLPVEPKPYPVVIKLLKPPRPEPPKYPDDPDGWIDEASDVLNSWGHQIDEADKKRLKTIAHHESGFDPQAVNDWDINAQAGTPSEGLMQTIPPTFEEFKLPGHDDIRDPVDNTIAAVQYMEARYGGIEHHPGIVSLNHGGDYKPY